ncbi:hypothetical protein HYQ44_008566 [Verticillium longisporum]|nr:hypothetical protein HYQ44_008566 [Verticillium longisporum]
MANTKRNASLGLTDVRLDMHVVFNRNASPWYTRAGLKVVLAVLGVSVVLGPGAGVCAGWYLREKAIRKGHEEDVELLYGRQSSGGAEGAASEQTPLLQ